MFLILDQQQTEFSLNLRRVAERKGIKTLLLTSAEIVQDLELVFFLSEKNATLRLRYQNDLIETHDIDGVYCGINTFEPGLWERFSVEDAEYASRETQALWLSILASFPCRVVNPPALDTLAGTLLSTPEILYLASQLGFRIPMMITLESGKAAAELLSSNVPVIYADLGEVWINEIGLSQGNISSLAQNKDHFRVKEKLPGKPVYVTLVGDQFCACTPDASGSIRSSDVGEVPHSIRTLLRTLHQQLNLNLSEYYFRTIADGTWFFSGYGRPPTFAVAAFGDALFEQIVAYATGG